MPGVIARKGESFEKLMRRWKRAVDKDDVINELRRREFYEKPTSARKRAKAAAKKRWERKQMELDPIGNKTKKF